MIIWGTTTINTNGGEGVFNCPRCSSQQHYRIQCAKGFFTLYFIPLIPLGERGRYVECRTCAGTYSEEVLSFDPAQDEAETQTQAFRLLIAFMVTFQRTDQYAQLACQRACSSLLGTEIPSELVQQEIRMASQMPDARQYVEATASEFAIEGQMLILQGAMQIAKADGSYTDDDRNAIYQFGLMMGIQQDQMGPVLSALENPTE